MFNNLWKIPEFVIGPTLKIVDEIVENCGEEHEKYDKESSSGWNKIFALMSFDHLAFFVCLCLTSKKSPEINVAKDVDTGIDIEKYLVPWHQILQT